MPLPKNIPESIEGLSLPLEIDEMTYQRAETELRVADWHGLIAWSPDFLTITYDAFVKYTSNSSDRYEKYGAIILSLNGGAHNAPVIGYLGMNVFDEIEDRERILPINVLIARNELGAPFSYGPRFNVPSTTDKFLRQRFFSQKMEGFLV